MVQTISAAALYQEQLESLNGKLITLKKKQNMLGWSRLALFILTAILAFYLFSFSILWGAIIVGVSTVLFIILVSIDTDNSRLLTNTKNLVKINEDELLVLSGQYGNRYSGSDFIPSVHDYARDLDIFGPHSLFQYINRCSSDQGKSLLAGNLLSPLTRREEITERHYAIKELSPQYKWRQQLASIILETPVTLASQRKIETWVNEPDQLFLDKSWKWILPVYSVIAIGIGLATLFGFINFSVFLFIFFILFLISGNFSRKASKTYAQLNGITKEAEVMYGLIHWLEEKRFDAPLLIRQQQSLKTGSDHASTQIKHLKNILNRFDMRLNWMAFIILNTFLLWDVRQVRSLTQWKRKNRNKVSSWFEVVAQFEVLDSLSTLYFNHPDWSWPVFVEYFKVEGKEIGHPLIPEAKRVTNDFHLQGYPKIAIITGSNMAGKSTFLRSLGVNILLAQMGAPVCACSFTLSHVRLLSSMRIEDNLAESTSTFYAELKKLKTIVDVVKSHEPVFILLDEILRGTNSLDRHHGSKALIKQFIKENGVALIATHDIELAEMANEFHHEIKNYHFDVQVKGEELYFDYLLKKGICTNLNATILMKKIGIEL